MAEDISVPRLLSLPAELVQNVLQFLEPTCLADVALTCRFLRNHALSDSLWQQHVNGQIPRLLTSAAPLLSFRDLYIAHHPYCFSAGTRSGFRIVNQTASWCLPVTTRVEDVLKPTL